MDRRVHDDLCSNQAEDFAWTMHFRMKPIPETRSVQVDAWEACGTCYAAVPYFSQRLPGWRAAKDMHRELRKWFVTWTHRNDLWEDEAT